MQAFKVCPWPSSLYPSVIVSSSIHSNMEKRSSQRDPNSRHNSFLPMGKYLLSIRFRSQYLTTIRTSLRRFDSYFDFSRFNHKRRHIVNPLEGLYNSVVGSLWRCCPSNRQSDKDLQDNGLGQQEITSRQANSSRD